MLRAGDLQSARASLNEILKKSPSDQAARMYLFQLLCVLCDWDKAEAQLRSLASLSPEAQMLSVTYAMAIAAERERAAAFAGVGPAAVLVADHAWAGEVAAALMLEGRGVPGAEERRSAAFDQAGDTPGRIDELAFDWIADADPRFGPTFEAIVAGRWGLIPFDAVETVISKGPSDLRDLVWLPAKIMFRTGQSVNAMLPARYPGLTSQSPTDHLLARATGWDAEQGQGARVWALGGGEEISLLSLRNLRFEARL